MNSTFETLNDLLHKNATSTVPIQGKNKQEEKIKEEVKNLPFEFSRNYLAQTSKQVVTNTVQYSQAATSMLINRVYEYNQNENNEFYQFIQSSLCGFIKILFKYFPAHFDFSLPMPEPIWQPIKKETENSLTKLANQGVDVDLEKLINTELLLSCKERAPDYVIGYYWKDLTVFLNQLKEVDHALTNAVVETLVSCNFNTGKFVLYVIEWTSGGLKDENSPVNYWANVLKLINRIPITPNMCLHKTIEPCKQLLVQSITTELFAAERMLPETNTTGKILTGMSVGQLAIFIRLMTDTEIIKSENINELVNFFSKIFKTTRTTEISAESLRQKYYNIDNASINIVRSYLGEMLNHLKKY
ncbi:MAG: hypothetical protein Q8K92_09050 [Leadbetterella sp.]|nr:hypothetical protein [Leadbetterella sp.]